MATSSGPLAWLLTMAGLLCCCSALRDVLLQMPPLARAGSSVTLRCLYDLEDDKLYAVKWYRGNFEFYRSTPHEKPDKQAFPYPDFHVDLSQSDDHQVTLRRVPLHMSGTFTCEVSTDAPAFVTSIKSGQLLVLDTVRRPLLTVSKDVYRPGDELEANCTSLSPASADPALHADAALAPMPPALLPGPPGRRHPFAHLHPVPLLPHLPPLQPHQLTAEQRAHLQREQDPADQPPMSFGFWVNNKPVPAPLVHHNRSRATLRRLLSEDDFSATGELRLKCVVTLANKYREPSHVVIVRRQDDEEDENEATEVEEPPVVVAEAHPAVNAPLPDPANRSSGANAVGPSSASSLHLTVVAVLLVSASFQLNPLSR